MEKLFDKVRDNIITSAISIILVGSLIFVGNSFINLRESSSELVERVASLESTIKDRPDNSMELTKVVENSTIISYLEKEVEDLRKRVRVLERDSR